MEVAAVTSSVAIGVTVLATLIVVALVAGVVLLLRSARRLQRAARELEAESARLLGDMRRTLEHADAELVRVDGLIGSAEAITDTVGSASRLAYTALANPLIKVMAVSSGSASAARRLRRRNQLALAQQTGQRGARSEQDRKSDRRRGKAIEARRSRDRAPPRR